MDIKDRIKFIMEKENMIAGSFAESIGIQQSTLSHVINGRNRPSLDVIMKIHQKYNYINLEWLLYGTGDFTVSSNYSSSSSSSVIPHNPPSLFDQNTINEDIVQESFKNHKETPIETPQIETKQAEIQEIKYIKSPQRRITEIKIFFDDNTYETFKSEK